MTADPNKPASSSSVDLDLEEQAKPGHGIPSQDPSPAAQQALSPEEAERESKSAFMGGGVMAGAAAGAAVGAVAVGPVGIFVGGLAGSVAGALGGAAAGTSLDSAAREAEEARSDTPLRKKED
ncbi:hypothetical protein ACSFA0_25605 [Variovorax sp. LT1P1]|uniref:hypothetical protein n=1 Tax=Variovorax sp. LT1P1 TaxID=3443730 RepID=UPI003F48A5A7